MTSQKFLEIWKAFHSEYILSNDWQGNYEYSKTWTNFILGEKHSELEHSPLGDFIKKYYPCRFRKEDGLCDLSISGNENFSEIFSLHENEQDRISVIKPDIFYPQYFPILIEHENNIYTCYEEMMKLVYQRARLKILITYNENSNNLENYLFMQNFVQTNFKNIIQQSNRSYPENSETEYMLFIGQKSGNELHWNISVYNIFGIMMKQLNIN